MKPERLTFAGLLLVGLLAGCLFASHAKAQEDSAQPPTDAQTPRTGPKFKAGDRVEAKRSGAFWYPGTVVSNMGGGRFLIKWDQTVFKNETVHQDNIRRPGEGEDVKSRRARRFDRQSSDTENQASEPQRAFTAQDYGVGEKVTWTLQGESLSGEVVRVISPRVMSVKRDDNGAEQMVTIEMITSKPANPKPANSKPSGSDSGQRPGLGNRLGSGRKSYDTLYIQGQEIAYKWLGSEYKAVVIRDKGDIVVAREITHNRVSNIQRSDILTPAEPRVVDPTLAKPDFSGLVEIDQRRLREAANPGAYKPGPATLDMLPAGGVVKVDNPAADGSGQIAPQQLYVCPTQPLAALTFRGREGRDTHAIIYDLATGKPSVVYNFPGAKSVVDISGGFDRAVTEADGFLSVWTLDAKTATLVCRLEPAGDGTRFDPKTDTATLVIDNGLLVTQGEGRQVYAWSINGERPKALWEYAPFFGVKATFTPQRTYVVLSGFSSSAVINPINGQVYWDIRHLGQADNPVFSPNGRYLAATDNSSTMSIYDVVEKKHVKNISLPYGTAGTHEHKAVVIWVDDDYVVINDKYLFSLATGMPVWEYTDTLPFQPTAKSICWALKYDGKGKENIVASRVISDRIALAAQAITPEVITRFKSGDPVSIKIDIQGGPPGIADTIRRIAEEHFKNNGNPIVNNAPTQLIATAAVGPENKLLIKATYPDSGEHMTSWRTAKTSLRLVSGNKILWGTSGYYGGPGPIVRRREDQTYQQVLDEGYNMAYRIFEKPSLPAKILKPVDQIGLNKSAMFPQ